MSTIRAAFIGCGAVVERSHLPAIVKHEKFTVTALIDRNQQQVKRLGEQYNVPHRSDDFASLMDQFDLAVVATPSASHASIGIELLQAGKHVLMEKPLATTLSQAQQLHSLAETKNALLAVSLVRRYSPHFQLLKQLLDAGLLGEIEEFLIEEGGVFNWPVQSVDFYRAQQSGGGVLMDHGAHLLDACLWWFGDCQSVNYADDSRGGVEADCELQMTMASGAKGVVRMSRLRALDNRLLVIGHQAEMEMNLSTGEFSLKPRNCLPSTGFSLKGDAISQEACSQTNTLDTIALFARQYDEIAQYLTLLPNQHSATAHGAQQSNLAFAAESLRSIELIERCYQARNPLPLVAW